MQVPSSSTRRCTSVTTCNECHGVTNGGGSVAGTNNNLPLGLTSSTMITTAASDAATGVPAGTLDQITHADVNVTAHDCNFCHTQVGVSTATGVAGQGVGAGEASTRASTPPTRWCTNGTTGRCSTCHMNVKPGASFSPSHASYTSASGIDRLRVLSLVARRGRHGVAQLARRSGGVPTVHLDGRLHDPEATRREHDDDSGGISNLPHPTVGSQACTTCHKDGGGRKAIGYDHNSTLDNANCDACHEAGSDLVSPAWNGSTSQSGGAGDTRPFTITSLAREEGRQQLHGDVREPLLSGGLLAVPPEADRHGDRHDRHRVHRGVDVQSQRIEDEGPVQHVSRALSGD